MRRALKLAAKSKAKQLAIGRRDAENAEVRREQQNKSNYTAERSKKHQGENFIFREQACINFLLDYPALFTL